MSDDYNFGMAPPPALAGLLGFSPQSSGGLLSPPPQQAAATAPTYAPDPYASAAPQNNGVLATIWRGLGNVVKLPFNVINAEAAQFGDIPNAIRFEQAQRAYQMQMARLNGGLIQGALGPGGIFGGGALAPPATAPDMSNPGPVGAPMLPGNAGTPPTMQTVGVPPQAGPLPPPPPPDYGAPPLSAERNPSQVGPYANSDQIIPGQTPRPGINIRDPRTQRFLAALDLVGNPAGKTLTDLGIAVAPKYSAARPGGMAMDETTGQFVGPSVPQDGTYNVPLQGGGFRNVAVPGASVNAAAQAGAVAGGKVAGESVGKLPYAGPLAAATAGGTAAGKAPFDLVDVPMQDGSTVKMPLQSFLALKKSGQFPGLGQGQSTAEAQYAKQDADAFAKSQTLYADPAAVMKMQNAHDITLQALHSAQALSPNAFTAASGQAAAIGNALGIPGASTLANNVSTYRALLPQVLRGTFTTFPRLEKEFEVVKSASANVNTPKDAASILLATQAAIHERNLAYSDFLANWKGAPSQQAVNRAFNNSPAGQASMFASPAFQGLTINGKPAVLIGNRPLKDGRTYGVFMPGTANAQSFVAQ
jgi:hypothetical protein